MAEFKEVAKNYSRLCSAYPNCNYLDKECPINKARDKVYVCRYWTLVVDPEKAEEVIMTWAKENPVKTNRKKFKEVFGIDFSDLYNSGFSRCIQNWLEKEYEEPEK